MQSTELRALLIDENTLAQPYFGVFAMSRAFTEYFGQTDVRLQQDDFMLVGDCSTLTTFSVALAETQL